MNATNLDTSVVIACHTQERWHNLVAAIESVRAQHLPPAAIVVAIDHNRKLHQRLCAELSGIDVVSNDSPDRGASATRNAGAAIVTTGVTAFLDDDETATPDWLTHLLAPFDDPRVVGTGGCYRPNWLAGKPSWFPDEFAWAVGGSFTGMPAETCPVRNVWSGNMAVRTAAFRAVGGFRSGFGKIAGQSRPEDTDLCIRVAAEGGGHWVYVPAAIIDHEVPAARSSFRFFVRRSFAEGRGKIEMSRHLDQSGTLGEESSYLTRTIPLGLARHLRHPRHGLGRAAAIAVGVAAAGSGAAVALASGAGRRRPQPPVPESVPEPVAESVTEPVA